METSDKQCSRCKKIKPLHNFIEPRKLCNQCIEDKKEYHRCKQEGIERVKEVKEPKVKFVLRNYYCSICEYDVRLCKKTQHEQTDYHKDRMRRKEHPEEFENEEAPEWKNIIHGKEFFHCSKCKLGVISSQWGRHCASIEHSGKKKTHKKNHA